jgi:hypothetical protein
MSLKIKCIKGEEVLLPFSGEMLVSVLKSQIESSLNIPAGSQKLLYKGRLLDDSKLLSDYSIKPNDTVILMKSEKPAVPAPVEAPVEAPVDPPVPEAESDLTVNPGGTFDFLMQSSEFLSILDTIRRDPRTFDSFIVQVEQQNPELFDLIMRNKKEFIALIKGDQTDKQEVQLTTEEFTDVKELMALGFTAQETLEAYLSCGKNKEIAANLLFSSYQ